VPTTTIPTITLVCPDCQHENEPQRIYCHSCGARLDRSKLIGAAVAKDEPDAKARERLQKMMRGGNANVKKGILKFAKVLLGAIALAALIVMALPIEQPPAKKSYEFAPMINMDMVSATSNHQGASLVYTEDQVNSYIASNLRRKDSPASQGYFPLKSVIVRFEEGVCRISSERQLYGYSIYSGSSYRVKIENGKIIGTNTGGYIGRMPIHPALMRYADVILQKAWDALARERNSVSKLASIEFHPQSVTLVTPR
jgi:hypothetical protein